MPGVLPAPNFDPIKTRIFNVSAGGSDGRSSNFAVDGGENSDIVNGGLLQNFTIEGNHAFTETDLLNAELINTAAVSPIQMPRSPKTATRWSTSISTAASRM